MVTLIKYGALSGGVKYNINQMWICGLSTDAKPTTTIDGMGIPNGSVFTEVDTGKTYMFDEVGKNWYEVSIGGGGGTSGGIKLVGETTTPLTDGATTNPITVDGQSYTVQPNDAVLYESKEFLWVGTYWREFGDMTGLGTAAFKDVSTSGDASTTQVVMGNDSRLGKMERIIMDSTETQDYYMQDSTPSNPSEGDYWFTDEPIVSADISAMTGYTKAQTASAIAATDTLNEAVGKLEKKADDNTSGLSSKQNQVLGSWTAGTATSHVTPTGTDTVLQALQKIDNNQRNDENNISSCKEFTDNATIDSDRKLYISATEPTGNIPLGSTWIDGKTIKTMAESSNLYSGVDSATGKIFGNDGTLYNNANYNISDYITISEGAPVVYRFKNTIESTSRQQFSVVWYNASDVVVYVAPVFTVDAIGSYEQTFNGVQGAVKVRFNYRISDEDMSLTEIAWQ